MTQPIDPERVNQLKAARIPDEVIEIFNDLIVENWNGSYAIVMQDEAVCRICAALEIDRATVFKLKYLDVEITFQAAGWTVKYDRSGYNESFNAYFQFSIK